MGVCEEQKLYSQNVVQKLSRGRMKMDRFEKERGTARKRACTKQKEERDVERGRYVYVIQQKEEERYTLERGRKIYIRKRKKDAHSKEYEK